jgi:hypothetical protein
MNHLLLLLLFVQMEFNNLKMGIYQIRLYIFLLKTLSDSMGTSSTREANQFWLQI